MFGHEGNKHLKYVVEVVVFVDCSEVVKDALQLVVFETVADHDELFKKQKDVGTNG